MKIPDKSQLPLRAKEQLIVLDDKKIAQFHKAFKDSKAYTPPTVYAVTMQGIFDLLNQFEIDWRKLLHASQKFIYADKLEVPIQIRAETNLLDAKFRAGLHWLNFETKVFNVSSSKHLVTCKSLLMVREN